MYRVQNVHISFKRILRGEYTIPSSDLVFPRVWIVTASGASACQVGLRLQYQISKGAVGKTGLSTRIFSHYPVFWNVGKKG
jgi:hypothetical protein